MATLLTGLGYIGAALLPRLVENEAGPVVVLENFFSTPRAAVQAALPRGVRLIEGDVADPRDVASAFDALGKRPATVYHLAAQPSAAVAAREPELTERSNLVGARIVLQAAHERAAGVVFGGSFRVYGDDLVGHVVDEHTPYGRVGDLSHLSKIYVEQLARMIGLPFVSVRLGVTYGLSSIMKTTPAFMTVPNVFCQRAVQGQPLDVVVDRPIGFIHVQDAAGALVSASARLGARVGDNTFDVVNAAPEVATIGQVARAVASIARQNGAPVQIRGAAASEASFEVHSSLDFSPRHTLADSLPAVLGHFSSIP